MDGVVSPPCTIPPSERAPGSHEVHLWRAPLDVPTELASRFADSLAPEERRRAARALDPGARRRRAAGRGWLRLLLGGYLDAEPASLAFGADAHGKPRLARPAAPWLRFTVSHSGPLVVFAVARGRDIGVDVEQVREDVDIDGLARRLFSARQRRELAAMPPAVRGLAFFELWTRHEACVKATGAGLARAGAESHRTAGWSLTSFDAGSGYAAAVAVRGDGVHVPPAALDIPWPSARVT